MTSSRIGNNKAVLSQTINSSFFKNTLLNVRLKTAYFRFVPSDGTFLLCRGRSRKPSFKMKMPLRGRVAHAFSALGFCGLVLPKYTPAPRSENQLFSYTLLDGSKEGEISPKREEFCSRNFVLRFLNRDILNQVSGLTLQEGTEGIKGFP